jgi:hypothetical protein
VSQMRKRTTARSVTERATLSTESLKKVKRVTNLERRSRLPF